MTTFSQIVDDLYVELVRPDAKGFLAGYLNQAIYEAHADVNTNKPVFFADNMQESIVTVSGVVNNGAFLWDIPNPVLFQGVGAIWSDKYQKYYRPLSPKVNQLYIVGAVDDRFNYYRTGLQLAINESGGNGATLRMCWFERTRSLFYYEDPASRPVAYNPESNTYTINPAFVGTAEEAMEKSTNWMIQRHSEMLKESVRSKFYRRGDNQFRATVSYSAYKTLLASMQEAEEYSATAHYGS